MDAKREEEAGDAPSARPTESVWSYPRPPRVEADARVRVVLGGVTIADTRNALRVLETSHPPVYYVPPADVLVGAQRPARGWITREIEGPFKGGPGTRGW